MAVNQNNDQIVKVFTKDGFVEKQMRYDKDTNRFEYTDGCTALGLIYHQLESWSE